jgi:polyhydroxyalkanoate synthesis regulator phasin
MTDDQRRDAGDPFREGVRAITGILGALRDAIEESFDDLKQQGDLSPEKAKEAARSTMRRAQEAVDDVRDRIDFVPRRDFEALREEVAELRRRLDTMGAAAGAPPTGPGAATAGPSQPPRGAPPGPGPSGEPPPPGSTGPGQGGSGQGGSGVGGGPDFPVDGA